MDNKRDLSTEKKKKKWVNAKYTERSQVCLRSLRGTSLPSTHAGWQKHFPYSQQQEVLKIFLYKPIMCDLFLLITF